MSQFTIHKTNDYDSMSVIAAREAFNRIKKGLVSNEKFVFGLATGQSPIGFYKELLQLLKQEPLDLSHFYTVNLDEYFPISQTSINSYYVEMMNQLWKPLSEITPTFNPTKQAFIVNGDTADPIYEASAYEEKIQKLGGVDLQLLGLGVNGHIGFNEPSSARNSRTRLVRLAEETIEINAQKFFDGDSAKVPVQAITMGIGTILEAKEIFMLVSGNKKAKILAETINCKNPSSENPASFLQYHKKVHIFADDEAAKYC